MLRLHPPRRSLAFTVVEVMAVSAILSGLSSESGGFRYAIDKANEVKGVNNLKQIYMLLQTQCIGGEMPRAALYPRGDPKTDPASIVRLLQGAAPELFVSPFAPEALKRKGLTFAWNDAVNGRDLGALHKDTWLLIDVAAFIADPTVPKPHRYLVLYADGRSLAVDGLPADIDKAVKDARLRIGSSQPKSGPRTSKEE